jgi:aclacinomycin oxidase
MLAPVASSSSSDRITPDDPRYRAVIEKRFNKRFAAAPDHVHLARSTDDVVAAVADAVREDRRLVVTSGGHCLEGVVSDPEVKVIIDISPMNAIAFDAERNAICVEAGATVGQTFRALAEGWGVVVPLGEQPAIGMGGHVAGGAFGFLCRQHGLAADYLHAVEVVTVDGSGQPGVVVATREPSDPNRELWWGLTGAGGGNFGVVTRLWFRSPTVDAADAADAAAGAFLPRAPDSITTFRAEWSWDDIDRPAFERLVRNHGIWSELTAGADSPYASIWTLIELHRKQFGKIVVRGVTTAGDAAEQQFDDFLAALGEGTIAASNRERAQMPWLAFALDPLPDLFAMPPGGVSMKAKDALLKRRLTDHQIGVAYDHLTSTDHDVMGGMLGMASYGGAINRIAPDATASAQRDAILDLACNTGWQDPKDEAKNLAWVRSIYRDLFADSGGVPVPGDAYAGSFINHPDVDLTDPALNTSGVPWHTLYFRDGYPRLQQIKARWDPRDVFRHALSIRAR